MGMTAGLEDGAGSLLLLHDEISRAAAMATDAKILVVIYSVLRDVRQFSPTRCKGEIADAPKYYRLTSKTCRYHLILSKIIANALSPTKAHESVVTLFMREREWSIHPIFRFSNLQISKLFRRVSCTNPVPARSS